MRQLHLLLLAFACLLVLHARTQERPTESIRDFVTKHYTQGLPYEQAKAYGKKALPELFQLLNDKSIEQYWRNIVTTIGIIGDPTAVKPLVQFIEGSAGEVSIHRFRAILTVFKALGFLAQNGSKEALEKLKDYTRPNAWKDRQLRFSYNSYKNESLGEVLGRQAIYGLGISGQAEAIEKLKDIRKQKDVRKDWSDNLDEAIRMAENVRKLGAQKVFGQKKS